MTKQVAVVGATGKTGRAVSAALQATNIGVRELTRANVDLESGEGLDAALAGCDVVYHLAPNLHSGEVEVAKRVIAAAQNKKIKRFVFHSVLAPQLTTLPHHIAKSRVEELVITSGMEWAILQPCAYAQNLNEQVVSALPYRATAPFAFVDLRDVALAATRLITDEATTFGTFEACGPITSVAEVSAALGWSCQEISLTQWRADHGTLPKYQFETLAAMFAHYDTYGLVGSTLTITDLIGRKPTNAVDALLGFR